LLHVAVAGAVLIAALLAAYKLAVLSQRAWLPQPREWIDLTEPAQDGPAKEPSKP
jgi:hypothetical protein